jgi:polar amino acid transport system substrate-binding protein
LLTRKQHLGNNHGSKGFGPGRISAVIGVVIAGALILSACSSSSSSSAKAAVQLPAAGSAAASLVPAPIKTLGTITIGSDASYAPNEFIGTDGTTVTGMDVDLGNAVAKELGLTAKFVNAPFDSIIPGLQSGKYQLGMSSFTDNKAREKVVDFVTYFTAGTTWAVQTGNPKKVNIENACGLKIAVQTGTVQVDDVAARSTACTKAGKPAINVEKYQLQTDATTAVVSGKDVAMLADSPVTGYAVAQSAGKLQLLGQSYGNAPYGIAVPQSAGAFKDAILAAMKALISNGTYNTILTKWGVQSGAITTPVLNGATS